MADYPSNVSQGTNATQVNTTNWNELVDGINDLKDYMTKGGHVYDVKAYGATGDGSTDDTVAIQSAIDAANTAGGGVVVIPRGVFRVGTLLLKDNVSINGVDKHSCIIKMLDEYITSAYSEPKQSVITNADYVDGNSNLGVFNLTVDGNKYNQTYYTPTANGITFASVDNFQVSNVIIKETNCEGLATYKKATATKYNSNGIISDVAILGCSGHSDQIGYVKRMGLAITDGINVVITNVIIDGQDSAGNQHTYYGVDNECNNSSDSLIGVVMSNIVILNCEGGVQIRGAGGQVHDNALINVNYRRGNAASGPTGALKFKDAPYSSVSRCSFYGGRLHGLHIDGSDYCKVDNCEFGEVAGYSYSSYDYINVKDSSYCVVRDSHFYPYSRGNGVRYAVNETGESDHNQFIHNVFTEKDAGGFYIGFSSLVGSNSVIDNSKKMTTNNGKPAIGTFGINDPTPSVKLYEKYLTVNDAATVISDLDDGQEGDTVEVFFGDENTTINFSSDIEAVSNGGFDSEDDWVLGEGWSIGGGVASWNGATGQLVSNGGFDSEDDWVLGEGWSIGGGVASKTAGNSNTLAQAITLNEGYTYLVTFMLTRTAGSITISLGDGEPCSAITASGSSRRVLVAGSGASGIVITPSEDFVGSIDSVYVYGTLHQQCLTDTRSHVTSFTVSGRTTGTVRIACGITWGTGRETNDTFEQQLTADGNVLALCPTGTFNGSIDDVSAKAVSALKGNGGVDWSPADGDFMRCSKIGLLWYCSTHECI